MTPLMRQYWDIKSLHPEEILLFRMGDFFEMFFDDAIQAAPILGIALTKRNKKAQDETPMCGVPHHSLAGPINKLLASGLKVAICDQIEDPKMAKGIVKRAVTRILTPGMVYDPESLDGSRSNYIASFDEESASFIDTSTHESFYFITSGVRESLDLLKHLPVAEIVISEAQKSYNQSFLESDFKGRILSQHEESSLPEIGLLKKLDLEGILPPASMNRLLSYVNRLNPQVIENLQNLECRRLEHRMGLGLQTIRHLEIFETYRGEEKGSFFKAIDRTRTSGGTRLLRQWVQFPLRDLSTIRHRQRALALWRENIDILKEFREILGGMGDLERRFGKINQPQCQARDLMGLVGALETGLAAMNIALQLEQKLESKPEPQFDQRKQASSEVRAGWSLDSSELHELSALCEKVTSIFLPDLPASTRIGSMIKKGISSELDEYVELSTNAHERLSRLEARERQETGIPSLKVRYNNVFGYYIEVTNTHRDKVPSHYQRKQTLTNAERYCTEELLELERKVLAAQTRRFDLEFEIYESARKELISKAHSILRLASGVSELDAISALSWLSIEENYVQPSFVSQREGLSLRASRHPVVEQLVRTGFISNDIEMISERCLLLTGPNMAGKSTLMRQVALSAILAQMGSFVPATEARLPLFDSIFTRIGASDQLGEGLSTFMVEMTEAAEMLKSATGNSLLVLDEIGRGTSTFDGMSLAQAILEHIQTNLGALTLFATHYHELTALENQLSQIRNVHMRVSEVSGRIRFLHTLTSGPAKKSYGIHVAELAGIPESIVTRAKECLKELESHSKNEEPQRQMSFFEKDDDCNPILKELLELEIEKMSPLEALLCLNRWKKIQTKEHAHENSHRHS